MFLFIAQKQWFVMFTSDGMRYAVRISLNILNRHQSATKATLLYLGLPFFVLILRFFANVIFRLVCLLF